MYRVASKETESTKVGETSFGSGTAASESSSWAKQNMVLHQWRQVKNQQWNVSRTQEPMKPFKN